VLIAEPKLLGELRDALPPHTASLVSATLDKDLGGISDRDLPAHVGGTIPL
jgi:protein required for attachment to host cells